MRKRLKDKKVTIYKIVQTNTSGKGLITQWRPIHTGTLWAYRRHLSGDEFHRAAQEQYKESVLFIVNWRADITASCIVRYQDVFYDIKRIDTFEGYKTDLTLYCDESARKWTDGDLLPFEGESKAAPD